MDALSWFLDVGSEALRLGGYSMSWIELVATVLYFVSVLLAIRPHVLTWPVGIVANVLLFVLFFQIELYSDMLLQTYYVAVSAYGWALWRQGAAGGPVRIGRLGTAAQVTVAAASVASILALGAAAGRLHLWWPEVFARPAAFPYADATTTVLSVVATLLLARKKIESWVLWLIVDAISVELYVARGVLLMAAEYVVFFGMAAVGLLRWRGCLGMVSSEASRAADG